MNIVLGIATMVMMGVVIYLNVRLNNHEADTTERKLTDHRIDNIITIHNATVEHYDDEIDQIIARMDQIVADIAELNKEHISDHRNLVDIRMRYINYRTPVQSNGGVPWAKDHKVGEDNE